MEHLNAFDWVSIVVMAVFAGGYIWIILGKLIAPPEE